VLTCKICLKGFKSLRYPSSRVCICGRCTNDLNKYKNVAETAYAETRKMLERGVIRRAELDLVMPKSQWVLDKAISILSNPAPEVEKALSDWVNRLVADTSNRTKIFKIIRAHRRGLLHLDPPQRWGYPKNWAEVARTIRKLDNFTCVACGATEIELHVHHIVYASNYGTHQKGNLVTLCRPCHELEHKRVLDFGENMENTEAIPET
jgi:5-methylcytosine-specific restriction endonuclease McrA